MNDTRMQLWKSTKIEADEFRKRIRELPEEKRATEALAEIAAQLMLLNTSIEMLEMATQDIADKT